ncbi:hypothetical protein M3649_03985 [Ureibacillus chungkukjangi]|uniref:hypothetical protein n=1 Tax=Ureibacillus chungkukjangi TaxID=1202712 RepID=UPI00203E503C|nr:hypothetical protein [Ureibacillus chungkukjangi]MCM3387292.1 hypothetical protein [Ureibacillus chungkukjangi]
MQYGRIQAEMIYLSLLHTLREYDIPYEEKHDLVTAEIDTRHEAVDLLDLLDGLHDFIVEENGFVFDEEE